MDPHIFEDLQALEKGRGVRASPGYAVLAIQATPGSLPGLRAPGVF